MPDFENLYRQLLLTDPALRKQWLLDHQPASVSPAHWWLGLVESAVSDVRHEQQGLPQTRPRADLDLAASLIDWALEQNFPIDSAIDNLVQITIAGLAGGRRPDLLPADVRPDRVANRALRMFGFTRSQAVARAAELRAKPTTDDDYSRPGEDPAEVRRRFRLLSVTDDYKDYHRLLSIQRMLGDLQRIRHLITDADVSAELAAWSNLVAELDPFPAATGVTTDDESP